MLLRGQELLWGSTLAHLATRNRNLRTGFKDEKSDPGYSSAPRITEYRILLTLRFCGIFASIRMSASVCVACSSNSSLHSYMYIGIQY